MHVFKERARWQLQSGLIPLSSSGLIVWRQQQAAPLPERARAPAGMQLKRPQWQATNSGLAPSARTHLTPALPMAQSCAARAGLFQRCLAT